MMDLQALHLDGVGGLNDVNNALKIVSAQYRATRNCENRMLVGGTAQYFSGYSGYSLYRVSISAKVKLMKR